MIVEPIEPGPSLLDAGPALLAELMAAVQRATRDIVRELGNCRVQTELGDDNTPLCWHLYAPRE